MSLADPPGLQHPLRSVWSVAAAVLVLALHAAVLGRGAAVSDDREAPSPVTEVEIELVRPPPPAVERAPPRPLPAPAPAPRPVSAPVRNAVAPPVPSVPAQHVGAEGTPVERAAVERSAVERAAPVAPAPAAPVREAEASQPYTGPSGHAGYLHNPTAPYPERARRLGWEGKTLLKVFVLASGRPERVEIDVSSGYPALDEAARDTVRNWIFAPARQGPTAVDGWVQVPIEFKLGR